MGGPRDSQRQAVYDWEKRCELWVLKPIEVLTLDAVRELTSRVWTGYTGNTKNVPIVRDGRGRRRACYAWDDNSVRFPKWSRQPCMVLHEVAHAIMCWKVEGPARMNLGKEQYASHGPLFVRIYCELLVAFLGYKPEDLLRELTAGKRNVYISDCNDLPWRFQAQEQAA